MLFEDFDKKIKEAANQHHPAYDEKAWRKMEKLLDEHLPQQKDDRRRVLFFLLIFILLGGGVYVAVSKPWNKQPASSELSQKNQNRLSQPASKSNTVSDQNNKGVTLSASNRSDERNNNEIVKQQSKEEKTNNNLTVLNLSSTKKLQSSATYNNTVKKNNSVIKNDSYRDKINRPDNNSVVVENNKKNAQEIIPGNSKDQPASNTNIEEKSRDENNTTNSLVNKKDQIVASENEKKPDENHESSKTEEAKRTVQSRKALKNKNGFSFSVSVGPDASKAGGSKTGKTTLVFGAGAGYTLNRFTLKTGVYLSKKIYWADPNDYKLSYTPPNAKFLGADANCEVIEIPLNLNYAFNIRAKSNWFAGIGLSSYLMKKENYVYSYESPSATYYSHSYQTRYENKHYFSVLDLSAGYARQINHSLSLSAEPYVEIPLTGIGVGKVHLNSAGVLFTLNIKPFNK